jgi:lipopolysaccharide/colanic/teichoic acid biosynthesis glycosyltransferase
LLKRAFDLVVSLPALILFSPLLLVTALWIRLDSRGPVFHPSMRAGRGGVPFRIFKFRSMVVGAENGSLSAGKDDPRITRFGRFLRTYKLDELPQLINVVLGDMSLVGPRPELLAYTRLYTAEEQVILTVRPGITDYASLEYFQISELLGSEDPQRAYEEKVLAAKNALRIQYVKEQSFWGDLVLIVRTLGLLGGMALGIYPPGKHGSGRLTARPRDGGPRGNRLGNPKTGGCWRLSLNRRGKRE